MSASTPTEISVNELAHHVPDVLRRVETLSERFVVLRKGRAIATISPTPTAATDERRGITLGRLIDLVQRAPRPDSRFADDVEAIQSGQPPMAGAQWDS